MKFQLTAARRRLDIAQQATYQGDSFNSQPPEGGWVRRIGRLITHRVSTHSRPKAAGETYFATHSKIMVSTHSRPKAAGHNLLGAGCAVQMFQLTAARRRLDPFSPAVFQSHRVSTHSRPKAAGPYSSCHTFAPACFNSQPPEGGWFFPFGILERLAGFNSQPPEGGWVCGGSNQLKLCCFNSQPPEGGWLYNACCLPAAFTVSTHSRPKAAG